MRKFFATLFVVLIATAIHAKLYNFAGIQATDIFTAGTIGTYTMDGVEIPSISAAAGTDINCTIYGMDDMVINYSNSSGKSNILKFAVDFLQADGKNVILTFSNVTIGDEIVLLVSAKGSTSATFEALSGCVADANNPASVEKKESIADYAEMRFQAIANEVQIKETSGGFRIITATIGESSAQEVSGTCGDNLTWYLNMSEGVLNISGYGAMYDYNSIDDVPWTNYREYITAISIPDGMTNIGDYAFWNCYNLTSLTIGQNVSDIGNYALYACFALAEINVTTGNSTFSSENGVLYNVDKTTLIQYPIGKTENTYTIPSNVNRIGNTAFSYSPYLTSVTIPGSVTNIGVEAFSYCTALMRRLGNVLHFNLYLFPIV